MLMKTNDGVNIFYQTYGDATQMPVVLLHGFGADYLMWTPQIALFPAKGLYLIVPDVRGHGQSDKTTSFSIAACARDVESLLDHLKIEQAAVVGVSMGGLIAQQLAVSSPHRVARLVVVDSYSTTKGVMAALAGKLASLLLTLLPKPLIAKTLELPYKRPEHKNIRLYFHEQAMRCDLDQLRMQRKALNDFNIADKLPGVDVPTLVLVGTLFGKMALKMARLTADSIPNAQLQMVEGGGDPSNLLAPAVFNQIVLAFLLDE